MQSGPIEPDARQENAGLPGGEETQRPEVPADVPLPQAGSRVEDVLPAHDGQIPADWNAPVSGPIGKANLTDKEIAVTLRQSVAKAQIDRKEFNLRKRQERRRDAARGKVRTHPKYQFKKHWYLNKVKLSQEQKEKAYAEDPEIIRLNKLLEIKEGERKESFGREFKARELPPVKEKIKRLKAEIRQLNGKILSLQYQLRTATEKKDWVLFRARQLPVDSNRKVKQRIRIRQRQIDKSLEKTILRDQQLKLRKMKGGDWGRFTIPVVDDPPPQPPKLQTNEAPKE